jgi:hypothetical protein
MAAAVAFFQFSSKLREFLDEAGDELLEVTRSIPKRDSYPRRSFEAEHWPADPQAYRPTNGRPLFATSADFFGSAEIEGFGRAFFFMRGGPR